MKERKSRNVRSSTYSGLTQKNQSSKRDKTLNTLRKQQNIENEKNLNFLDMILNFGVLC